MRAWSRLAAAVVCGLLSAPVQAAPGTVVVFTVDVESNETFRLPDQMRAVCDGGVSCGVSEIVRLLEERRWAGTFFLNVYEQSAWGEPAMRDIAVGLQAAGQDVALHTHPQWSYDPARWAMHQYGVDEQIAIIRDGMRLLQVWTGRPVVAHRAGAYAADERTLAALERNGVAVDSSMFWQHASNRLDGLGLARNVPSRRGGLTEIPVTAYQREDRPRIGGGIFAPVMAVRKIDPNWFATRDEMTSAIDAEIAAQIPVLVVFLHSFSFMKGSAAHPLADARALEMFRAMLNHIATRGLQVVTMREVAERDQPGPVALDQDVVPRVAVRVDLDRYVWRRIKLAGGMAWTIGLALALGSAATVVVAVRRGAPRR